MENFILDNPVRCRDDKIHMIRSVKVFLGYFDFGSTVNSENEAIYGYGFVNNGKTLVVNSDSSTNVIQWKFRSSEDFEYDGTRDSHCIHLFGATATASNGKLSIDSICSVFRHNFFHVLDILSLR